MPVQFIDQLLKLADLWSAATGRSRARLSTIVADNGRFFGQIEKPGATCTVATFEKFLSYFRDGANWPDGLIPHDAAAVLSNFANIATAESLADSEAHAEPSPGKIGEISRCANCERSPGEFASCVALGCPQASAVAA